MSFDNAYESLLGHEDSHWAFGTGFSDALVGVNRE
ncbi:MAG TPA: phenylacetate-CoA oxygenase subunit PaaI, partial [Lentzea sp.]